MGGDCGRTGKQTARPIVRTECRPSLGEVVFDMFWVGAPQGGGSRSSQDAPNWGRSSTQRRLQGGAIRHVSGIRRQ